MKKLDKALIMSTETCGRIQKICMPETEIISSKKKNPKYEILNNLYFRPKFVF